MTPARRFALLAAVVVVAVVAFIVLKPSNTSKKQGSTPASATTSTGAPGSTPGKGGPAGGKPAIQNLRVQGGKPVGGIQDLTFNKGDTVQFAVTADVSDEVHVHGYDLKRNVAPGHPAVFRFPASIDGEFDVELESRSEQIASLRVNP